MKQPNPLFSLLGMFFVVMFFLGVGVDYLRHGGRMFSPGDLTSKRRTGTPLGGYDSHADFEKKCDLCHQPLQTTQDQLCMDCHQNVADQISANSGVHGQIPSAGECRICHPDHQGRNFDSLKTAMADYDHSSSGFSLLWHRVDYAAAPMRCQACHTNPEDFSVSDSDCETCHADYDRTFMTSHVENFGDTCLQCHDGVDRMADFDHSRSDFPLEGKHAGTNCQECHAGGRFEDLPLNCSGCHKEPAVHLGVFTASCEDCHDVNGWSPARLDGSFFDHTLETSFTLEKHRVNYDQQPINCQDCHTVAFDQMDNQTCISCHGGENSDFMAQHRGDFGDNCLECHDGTGEMANFDHSVVFLLDGRHADLQCKDCHVDKQFKGTPRECSQCHAEPEIHAGYFGLECQECHTSSQWTPASLRFHSFPLNHGKQGEVACLTCHPASYVEYTCYGCHEHDPGNIQRKHTKEGISLQELPNCAKCHPTGREEEGD